MKKTATHKRLLSLALVLVMVMSVLPVQIFAVATEKQTFTKEVTTADTAASFAYAFEAGQAYKVTATWANDPTFTGSPKGWSLTTGSTAADGDLIVKASTGSASGSADKVAKSYSGIFTATADASNLYLDAAGIAADNSVTITVEPTTAEAGLVVDMTVTVPAGTRYTNVYTDAAFTANEEYDYSVQWTNQPTHSANNVRAWKIQPASSSTVDGSGGDWYVGPKSASGVSDQTASGTQTANVTLPVFNLFTQYIKDENTVHITIKKPVTKLDETVTVTASDASESLAYTFEEGQAYKVTATWTNAPSFPTGQKGWSLTTGATSADGDLVVLAATGSSYGDKVASSAAVIFTATVDATTLYLDATGITEDNTVTVTVEPVTADENLVVDLTVTLPAGTRYTNVYTDAAFTSGEKYDYSVQWTNQPTHSANDVRAWKIQSVPNSGVDGAGDMFDGPKSASGVSAQSASGTYTAAATNPVFNLFTQYIQDENTVHITVKKYVEPTTDPTPSAYSPLNEEVAVAAGESKFFQYAFQAGKTYRVTAAWESAPSFSGSLSGWQLQTVSDAEAATAGDLVVKQAKKNDGGTATIGAYYQGTFTATQAMGALQLSTTSLAAANAITVQVEEVTLSEGVVYEGTVSLSQDMPWLHTWSGVNLDTDQYYKFTLNYASAPGYTSDNQDKTAWKLHVTDSNTSVDTGSLVNSTTASGNTATQSFDTVLKPTASKYLSFFTQRTTGTNTVTLKVEEAEEPVVQIPYDILDEVSIVKSYSIAGGANKLCAVGESCTTSHPMQAFDVYDGILFASYDGGYIITYDLETGEKLSGFLMGCGEYSHEHHCGNAMFGTAKYDPNDRFPLFYSSGDLSTKDCYVERIITDSNGIPVGSEMVQRIDFDMGSYAGANGAQAVVDPANNRIIFQQRKLSSIGNLNNAFVMGEYPLPAPTEGTLQADGSRLVEYDTSDFLVPAYELPYWSAFYQGADYVNDLFLQTHGLSSAYANSFGSANGVMVFDYTTTGHDFTRYIPMTPVVGVAEPQGISVCDDKLYISYGGKVYELEVELGVKETGYDLACATNAAIQAFVESEVTKQLTDGGKGYTLKSVEVKSITATGFTADVTVKTPYTVQTVTVSGTVGEHSFTGYVSDGNATCTADGTKTAVCDNDGCTATDTVADPGTKGHKLEKVAYKAPTTQAEGNIEHYVCKVCGKLYSDDQATKELTKAETVLKRLEDTSEPTTEPTTAPTTEPTTAPTGKPTDGSPATGEAYPVALLVWLMLGSVLALAVTLKRRSV